MDPITAETLIKLTQHYEQLLSEEKKKTQMYQTMALCYGDISQSSTDGVCSECSKLCFSVTPRPVGFEYQTFVDKKYNYKTCQECNELTCKVCCNEIAQELAYNTDIVYNIDAPECPKCFVKNCDTVVRD